MGQGDVTGLAIVVIVNFPAIVYKLLHASIRIQHVFFKLVAWFAGVANNPVFRLGQGENPAQFLIKKLLRVIGADFSRALALWISMKLDVPWALSEPCPSGPLR